MAYKNISKTISLPTATRSAISGQQEDEIKSIKQFGSDLVQSLSLFFGDLIQAVNDLISGRIAIIKLQKQTAPPVSPEGGWVVYADGTSWNPGAGEGIYAFYAGVWNKL